MSTEKDGPNVRGLMNAARQVRDPQVRAQAAVEALRSQLARSPEFAKQFDQLTAREDRDAIVALIREEIELPKEAKVTILEIKGKTAKAKSASIKVCIFGVCVTITVSW